MFRVLISSYARDSRGTSTIKTFIIAAQRKRWPYTLTISTVNYRTNLPTQHVDPALSLGEGSSDEIAMLI